MRGGERLEDARQLALKVEGRSCEQRPANHLWRLEWKTSKEISEFLPAASRKNAAPPADTRIFIPQTRFRAAELRDCKAGSLCCFSH